MTMREYDVTVCSEECGACEFDFALMQWTQEVEGFVRLSEPPITTWRTVTGCSECMTHLGTSEDGRPWRERMVPASDADRLTRDYEGMMTRREVLELLLAKHAEWQKLKSGRWGEFEDIRMQAELLEASRFFGCARVLGFDLPQQRDQIAKAAREEMAAMDAERPRERAKPHE